LLSRLGEAGLTQSQLAAGEGALLAKPARKISLPDVYQAVEDTEQFSMDRSPPCASCTSVVRANSSSSAFRARRNASPRPLSQLLSSGQADRGCRVLAADHCPGVQVVHASALRQAVQVDMARGVTRERQTAALSEERQEANLEVVAMLGTAGVVRHVGLLWVTSME